MGPTAPIDGPTAPSRQAPEIDRQLAKRRLVCAASLQYRLCDEPPRRGSATPVPRAHAALNARHWINHVLCRLISGRPLAPILQRFLLSPRGHGDNGPPLRGAAKGAKLGRQARMLAEIRPLPPAMRSSCNSRHGTVSQGNWGIRRRNSAGKTGDRGASLMGSATFSMPFFWFLRGARWVAGGEGSLELLAEPAETANVWTCNRDG